MHNTGANSSSMHQIYVWLTVSNLVCAENSLSLSWTKWRLLIQHTFLNAPLQDDVKMCTAEDFNKQIQYWIIINYYAFSKPVYFVKLVNRVINRLSHGEFISPFVPAPRLVLSGLGFASGWYTSLWASTWGDINFSMQ